MLYAHIILLYCLMPVDNIVDSVESDANDVTIDELEQLLKNIENNVVRDPELIQELAALTPLLESLQS